MKSPCAVWFLFAATVVCATASPSHDQNASESVKVAGEDKRTLLSIKQQQHDQPFHRVVGSINEGLAVNDNTAELITKVVKKPQEVADSSTKDVRRAQDIAANAITLSFPTEQVSRNSDMQAEWDILNQPLQDPHSGYADVVLNRAQELRGEPDACSDVLTTTFLDVNDEKRNCTWLADQLSTDFNRANLLYCGKAGGFVLKEYRTPLAAVVCPVTCTRPCTYEESTCKDSSALVGSSATGKKKKKKCNWIKKRATRIARYCSVEEGVRSRGDAACPKTCGKCGQLSASAMTEAPSNAPSAFPTVSASPSSNPTAFPTVTV